jgi:hypothetical protein
MTTVTELLLITCFIILAILARLQGRLVLIEQPNDWRRALVFLAVLTLFVVVLRTCASAP